MYAPYKCLILKHLIKIKSLMLKRVNKLFIQYQYDTRKIAPWKIALRKIVPYPNPNPNPNL